MTGPEEKGDAPKNASSNRVLDVPSGLSGGFGTCSVVFIVKLSGLLCTKTGEVCEVCLGGSPEFGNGSHLQIL